MPHTGLPEPCNTAEALTQAAPQNPSFSTDATISPGRGCWDFHYLISHVGSQLKQGSDGA